MDKSERSKFYEIVHSIFIISGFVGLVSYVSVKLCLNLKIFKFVELKRDDILSVAAFLNGITWAILAISYFAMTLVICLTFFGLFVIEWKLKVKNLIVVLVYALIMYTIYGF